MTIVDLIEMMCDITSYCQKLHTYKASEIIYEQKERFNISEDIINYLIKVREADFKSVLNTIKKELGIQSFYTMTEKRSIFGGFYNRISKFQSAIYVKTYPESVLDEYDIGYNKRFLDDNISLQTQDYFDIGYDIISQRITIPIRNAVASSFPILTSLFTL